MNFGQNNPCYELNLDINENYKTLVLSAFDELKDKNKKYLQPEATKKEFPELWNILGPLEPWFCEKVRIINHTTEDLGTSAIHLDVNEHLQYESTSPDAITQCALNIPLFEPVGDITRWWRQKNPDVIMPYDFWIGDGNSLETHKTNNNIYIKKFCTIYYPVYKIFFLSSKKFNIFLFTKFLNSNIIFI